MVLDKILKKITEIFNAQVPHFQIKKKEIIKTKGIFERLINWLTGDLIYTLKPNKFLILYL